MNSPESGLRVASILAGIICLVHVVRLITGTEIRIGPAEIALGASLLAAVVAGALSVWFWRLASAATKLPKS